MKAVIGALRAVLGMDTVAFEKGVNESVKQVNRLAKEFRAVGKDLESIGKTLSLAITAPLVGFGTLAIKSAADFQSAMTKIQATTGATGKTLDDLSNLARNLGKNSTFGAVGVANAIELLAKQGVAVRDIMGGAAAAAVTLAQATGSELAPAANTVADTMERFHKSAADLPQVINGIAGTVKSSRMSLEDYSEAMRTGGMIAAQGGMSFEDFNAGLAITATQFANGAEAGSAFRNFLMRLGGTSAGVQKGMHALGLEFYDSSGRIKPLADIAQILHDRLAGLSDQARLEVLSKIFPRGAVQSAVALMNAGADGVRQMQAAIGNTSAVDQAALRLQTFDAQLQVLKSSFQELQIAVGNAGLLQWATEFVQRLTGLVAGLAQTDPALLKVGIAFGAVAAAAGPVLFVVGQIIEAIGGLTSAMVALAPSMAPLIAAAGPWAALAAAVAAAIAVLYVYRDAITISQDGTVTLGDAIRSVAALFGDLKAVIDALSFKNLIGDLGLTTDQVHLLREAIMDTLFPLRALLQLVAELPGVRGQAASRLGIGEGVGGAIGTGIGQSGALPPDWATGGLGINWGGLGGIGGGGTKTGGGANIDVNKMFGGAGGSAKSARERIDEYIASLSHAVAMEQEDVKQREISEALYKAEQIALQGKTQLTDADTAAIISNVTALQAAKEAQTEKTRLDSLAKKVIDDTSTAQEKFNKGVADLNLLLQSGRISQEQYSKAVEQLSQTVGEKGDTFSYSMLRVSDYIESLSDKAADAFVNMDKGFGDSLRSMGKEIEKFALKTFLFDPIFSQLAKWVKGIGGGGLNFQEAGVIGGGGGGFFGGGGGGGLFSGLFNNLFSGGGSSSYSSGYSYGGGTMLQEMGSSFLDFGGWFASGGGVSPGKWYGINERGVEAFVPNVAGRIISNEELRGLAANDHGGRVVNQNIVITTPNADSFRRSQRQVTRQAKQTLGQYGTGAYAQ